MGPKPLPGLPPLPPPLPPLEERPAAREPGRSAEQRRTDRIIFWEHVAAFAMLNGIAAWLKFTVWAQVPWDLWVPLGWGAALALHGLWAHGKLGR